jgi:lipopolysaccharide export system protein LptA
MGEGMGRLAMRRMTTAGASLVALAALVAGPAQAQLAQNSSSPVDISADQLETQNAACVATYRGAVEALQDTVRLRSDVLKIYIKPDPTKSAKAKPNSSSGSCGNEIDHMEATGSVYYVTPERRVRGDMAVYDKDNDTITITGDVVVADADKNVAQGSKMVIKVSTGDGQLESGPKAKMRVRTVYFPKKEQKPGASSSKQPAAAAPPAAPH